MRVVLIGITDVVYRVCTNTVHEYTRGSLFFLFLKVVQRNYIRGQCTFVVLILQCKTNHYFVKLIGKAKT